MSNEFKPNQKSDLIYWLIAVGLLFTGIAAPVGVVMIVLKLMGGKKKGRRQYGGAGVGRILSSEQRPGRLAGALNFFFFYRLALWKTFLPLRIIKPSPDSWPAV